MISPGQEYTTIYCDTTKSVLIMKRVILRSQYSNFNCVLRSTGTPSIGDACSLLTELS